MPLVRVSQVMVFSRPIQPLGYAKAYKEMTPGRASGYGRPMFLPSIKFFFGKFFIMAFH